MNRIELKKFFDDNIESINSEVERSCADSRGRVYDYAMNQTKRELKQAVEGMFHNLNTLN